MARTRVTRRIPEWVIGLAAITLVVLVTAWVRPAFLEAIEYQLFDLRLKWFSSRAPAQNIAIVAVDEESIASLEGATRGAAPAGKVAGVPEFAAKSALTNLAIAADQAQAGAPRPAAPGETATQRFTTRPGPAEG